jgi:hypothetical protein
VGGSLVDEEEEEDGDSDAMHAVVSRVAVIRNGKKEAAAAGMHDRDPDRGLTRSD